MSRQYVGVKFRQGAKQVYTYHNDGEPVVPGDTVKIPGRGEDGWQSAFVEEVGFTKPSFPTKAIMGRVDPNQPDMLDVGDDADLFGGAH